MPNETKRLTLKDLVNRIYSGKDPVSFEYIINNNDGKRIAVFRWLRLDDEGTWRCSLQFDGDYNRQTKIFMIEYKIPPTNQIAGIPLIVIASIGMHYIKGLLQESIQEEAMVDFVICEAAGVPVNGL